MIAPKIYGSFVRKLPVSDKNKSWLIKSWPDFAMITLLFVAIYQSIFPAIQVLAFAFGFPVTGALIGYRRKRIFGAVIGIIISLTIFFIVVEFFGGTGGLGRILS